MWTSFVTKYTSRAFQLDALESSHPLKMSIQKEAEIDEAFDAISYSKGASLIRMLVSSLTSF